MVQPWNLGPPVMNFAGLGDLGNRFFEGYKQGKAITQENERKRLVDEAMAANGGAMPGLNDLAAIAFRTGDSNAALQALGLAGQTEQRKAQTEILRQELDLKKREAAARDASAARWNSIFGGQGGQPSGPAAFPQSGARPASADGGGADAAIAGIESGGRYDALGPVVRNGDRAHGKYQVMGANIGPWTEKYFGRRLTPAEFIASPEAQEAVFQGEFGRLQQKYGPAGAARAWFAGEGGMNDPNRKDVLGTTVAGYERKFLNAYNPTAPSMAYGPQAAGIPPQAAPQAITRPMPQPAAVQAPQSGVEVPAYMTAEDAPKLRADAAQYDRTQPQLAAEIRAMANAVERKFAGGQRAMSSGARPPVDVAETEADVQRLEAEMMPPGLNFTPRPRPQQFAQAHPGVASDAMGQDGSGPAMQPSNPPPQIPRTTGGPLGQLSDEVLNQAAMDRYADPTIRQRAIEELTARRQNDAENRRLAAQHEAEMRREAARLAAEERRERMRIEEEQRRRDYEAKKPSERAKIAQEIGYIPGTPEFSDFLKNEKKTLTPEEEVIQREKVADRLKLTGEKRELYLANGKLPDPKERPLSDKAIGSLGEAGTNYSNTNRYLNTFKDAYGGWRNDTVGNVANKIARNTGLGNEEAATWWQDYDKHKNKVRNELFGSALTKPEAEAFERADITPGMTPQAIRRNLEIQKEAATAAAKKLAGVYNAQGKSQEEIEAAIGFPMSELGIKPKRPGKGDAGSSTVQAGQSNRTSKGVSWSIEP